MPPRSRNNRNPILDIATQEQNLPVIEATETEPRPGWATPEAAEEYALKEVLKYVECRDMGHPWRRIKDEVYGESIGLVYVHYLRTMRCTRCRSMKVLRLDEHGRKVMSDSRVYADGYIVQGLGRIAGEAKAVIRRVSIERYLAGEK